MTAVGTVARQEARRRIRYLSKQNGDITYVYFRRNKNISFLLTNDKTFVITYTGTFLIKYDLFVYKQRLDKLRSMIIERKIRSMADLISYCNYRPSREKYRMAGLELVPTVLERHL